MQPLRCLTLLLILLCFPIRVSATTQTYSQVGHPRTDRIINGTWRFHKGDIPGASLPAFKEDATWTHVTLPHTWNNRDGQDGGGDYYRGIGWYRATITTPASPRRRFYIQFDGANLVTDVWVNGRHLGQHAGGYAAFRFDATEAIAPRHTNLVAVRVDNSPHDIAPLDADYTFFGGLYRPVHLLSVSTLHLDMMDYGSPGVYLTPTYDALRKRWTIASKVKVRNDTPRAEAVYTRTILVDPNHGSAVVATITAPILVAGRSGGETNEQTVVSSPHLWDGRHDPYLYTAYIELHQKVEGRDRLLDVVSQPVGFRYFHVDPNSGFFLNGRHLALHGVNKHQDRFNKGWAVSDSDSDDDFRLLSEMGVNAVRMCHYQHSRHEYDLGDREGFVLWGEIPLVDRVTLNGDPGAFNDNARQQLTELIRQNYNHPSICFWSIANEILLKDPDSHPDPKPLLRSLNDLVHQEDRTRPSVLAAQGAPQDQGNFVTDLLGFNQYFGWYFGTLAEKQPGSKRTINTWLPEFHKNYPTRALALTEYGAGSGITVHAETPRQGDHSEEYQALFHESYWNFLKTTPYVWGTFVWNMFDFAVDGRDEGDTKGRNDKGLVTFDRRTKKDAFYWYKANWTTEPFVYITSRRFARRTNSVTDIKVYSNCSVVWLTINGRLLPSPTPAGHIFTWPNVALDEGVNTVRAFGNTNVPDHTCKDIVTWYHPPTR